MAKFEPRLLSQWETSGMGDDDGCCCCCCCRLGEAGLPRRNTRAQLLHKKETTLRRASVCLAAAAVLMLSVAVASVIVIGLAAPGLHAAKCQLIKTENCTSAEQPKAVENPSAMLTVPNNTTTKKYLPWESGLGHAYCQGGFSYSDGSLVVPRTGVYRIFLQITYMNDTCKDDVNLSHTVLMYSESYTIDVPLLTSIDTVSCSKKPWTKSLYTSGLQLLEANTRLRVESSHPHLIVSKESEGFFGAELLP
ncbi:hypothetical protein Q5P01_014295 [Channa striata]|uniref:THD domain-containing protein n=1 Tax=Channa striata TaxID=64152 RepID=A0AA88SKT8_CHASR|nr:hypothetical protein Q5P01_014295 [Channa striata]